MGYPNSRCLLTPVPKTLYSSDHEHLVSMLRSLREKSGLRQTELAGKLARPQSFVSKVESGQRRLDLIELRAWCEALDADLVTFVRKWLKASNH